MLSEEAEIDLAVRRFELRLLDELGYRPALERCAVCDRRLKAVTNYWSADAGGAVCPECADKGLVGEPLSLNALKVLRLLQRSPFAEAACVRLSATLAGEVEARLAGYVRHVLERDVRSAHFLETLRREAAAQRTREHHRNV